MKSTRPFPEAFRAIREMQGLSEREVSKRAARHGSPTTHSTMHRIYNGQLPAFPYHIKAISAALAVDPDTFVEYRLWKVMQMFDIVGDAHRQLEPVPFDRALHNLERFEELTAEASRRPASAVDPSKVAAGLEDPESAGPARRGRA
jgi:transcriptional regulator with XRE-family HTH domain